MEGSSWMPSMMDMRMFGDNKDMRMGVLAKPKVQVKCRNFEKTGCQGQARTLGGVGRNHYAYYCTICRDSWAQLRPSAIGSDGNLNIRETKRKAPALPESTAKKASLGNDAAESVEAQIVECSSEHGGSSSSQSNPAPSQSEASEQTIGTGPDAACGTDSSTRKSDERLQTSEGEAGAPSSGLTVAMAQSILSGLERQVFGEERQGDIKQRLSALEKELGLSPPAANCTIFARLDHIRG